MRQTGISLSAKIGLIGFFYLMPMISFFYSFFLFSGKNVDFIEAEMVGSKLLEISSRLKIDSFYLEFRSEIEASKADFEKIFPKEALSLDHMEKNFTDLEVVLEKWGDASSATQTKNIKTTQPFTEARTAWKDYNKSAKSSEDIKKFIIILRGDLDNVFQTIPEHSNLILDFDLPTSTLISLVESSLRTISKTIQIPTPFNDAQLSKDQAMLIKSALDEMAAQLTKYQSFESLLDGGVKNQLRENMISKTKSFIDDTQRLLDPLLQPNSSESLKVLPLTEIYIGSYVLYRNMQELIQAHLASRVSTVWSDRFQSMAFSCFFWVIALLLSFKVQKSIVQSIHMILKRLSLVLQKSHEVSEQLSQSANSVSESAATEAAAVQESVASLSEMTSMLSQTSKDAENTKKTVQESSQTSQNGISLITNLGKTMDKMAASTQQLMDINKIIEEIDQKTRVINDIVFKSQLLAVNAAIEAARAGHQGKGFGVVANEVSNLATISGKAATEITTLIQSSQQKVNAIVQQSSELIKTGQQQTSQSIVSFDLVAKFIESIKESADQIFNATREQNTAIEQTSLAMSSLNKSAQTNQYLSQQCLAQSNSLRENSKNLNNIEKALLYAFFGREEEPNQNLIHFVTQNVDVSKQNQDEHAGITADTKQSLESLTNSIINKASKINQHGQKSDNKAKKNQDAA